MRPVCNVALSKSANPLPVLCISEHPFLSVHISNTDCIWIHLCVCMSWCVQILAVSSAAAAFDQMPQVPPLTLASWRLQLTSVILMPGCIWQLRGLVRCLSATDRYNSCSGHTRTSAVLAHLCAGAREHTARTSSVHLPVALSSEQFAVVPYCVTITFASMHAMQAGENASMSCLCCLLTLAPASVLCLIVKATLLSPISGHESEHLHV